MTLRCKMIDFAWSNHCDQLHQTSRVRHVAVVKLKGGCERDCVHNKIIFTCPLTTGSMRYRIGVQMLDSASVEGRTPSNDAMYTIAFGKQQFC